MMLGDEPILVVSKPGLPDWNMLPSSTKLLADNAVIRDSDRILLFGCHHGVLSVYLARHLAGGHLYITDNDGIALSLAEKTLVANNISGVDLVTSSELPPQLHHTFDTVLIQLPKGKALYRRWLLQANLALHEQGKIYLAGPNKSGIEPAINDAMSLYGNKTILAYKKGNRLASFEKMSQPAYALDWSILPGIAPGTWVEFKLEIRGTHLSIHSLPGVFSFEHLDEGTQLLLENIHITPGSHVLDVGCGYGIIGMFAAMRGASWVDLVDSNLLAITACKENLAINNITNASVFLGDLFEPVQQNRYDLILSNPPFHTGQAVDYQMVYTLIQQAYQALAQGGQLIIVANRFIPYYRMIKQVFGVVNCLAESTKFHVLSGLK